MVKNSTAWFFYQGLIQDCLFSLPLCEVILQRTVMDRFFARALQACYIGSVFDSLQKLYIMLDGENDRDGLAFTRHDFRFAKGRFHDLESITAYTFA